METIRPINEELRMEYIHHDKNTVVEIVIGDNMLQENVEMLKTRFNELIESGNVKIVLNMKHSKYVSSLCLAVIVDIKKKLISMNGDLKIVNINRLVKNLLEITNLVKKFDLFDSVEAAVASFNQH